MEDIVNLHVRREFMSACDWRGSLEDLKGADVTRLELGRWVDVREVEVMSREANFEVAHF